MIDIKIDNLQKTVVTLIQEHINLGKNNNKHTDEELEKLGQKIYEKELLLSNLLDFDFRKLTQEVWNRCWQINNFKASQIGAVGFYRLFSDRKIEMKLTRHIGSYYEFDIIPYLLSLEIVSRDQINGDHHLSN